MADADMKINVFGVDEALAKVAPLVGAVKELAHEIKILTSKLHEASNVAERAKAIIATDDEQPKQESAA